MAADTVVSAPQSSEGASTRQATRQRLQPFLDRLIDKPELVGIVLLSNFAASSRRMPDEWSDVDLAVYVSIPDAKRHWTPQPRLTFDRLQDKLPTWLPNFSFHPPALGGAELNVQQHIIEYEEDARTRWGMSRCEAYARSAEILHDPTGRVSSVVRRHLAARDPGSDLTSIAYLAARLYWDVIVLPERQAARAHVDAAHLLLNQAINEAIELSYRLAGTYPPNAKWCWALLDESVLASSEIAALREAVCVYGLDMGDVLRRRNLLEPVVTRLRTLATEQLGGADPYDHYSARGSHKRQLRHTTVADQTCAQDGSDARTRGDVCWLLPSSLDEAKNLLAQRPAPWPPPTAGTGSSRTVDAADRRATTAILLTPGPVQPHPAVRAAMSTPWISHLSTQHSEMLQEVSAGVSALVGGGSTVVVGGPATAALEAALRLLTRQASTLVVASNGYFGDRLAQIGRALGIEVRLAGSAWGQPLHIGNVDDALDEDCVLAAVHLETSTGQFNDLDPLRRLADARRIPFLIDAVSSVGALPVGLAGHDVVVSASHKAVGGPAGISFVTATDATWDHMTAGAGELGSLALDLRRHRASAQAATPRAQWTPPVQVLAGTREALARRAGQDVEERARQLRARAAALTDRLVALGFTECFPAASSRGSPILALNPPSDPDRLRSELERAGYAIAGGLGQTAGTAVRVALLGELTDAHLDAFVQAVSRVIQRQCRETPS
jgi:aspartate aminotransferase-like enzyme